MFLKQLAKNHLDFFFCLKGGCTGLSESTLVKIPHCWKSYVVAHLYSCYFQYTLKFDYSGACPPKIEPGEDSEGLSFGSWLLIL